MKRAMAKPIGCAIKGFTLLEVLVALLVLSIGLLGLAGLQTLSLRNNQSAFQRSQAVVLAYDALDRVRGNRDQAAAYVTAFDEVSANFTTTNCPTAGCTAAQMAENDLAVWKTEVARLPAGAGQIAIDANNKATVEVRWSDNRDGANPVTISVETVL